MADFQDYLKPGMRGHLIGVGGVSMAPLAEVLAGMGLVIDGSDMAESEKTQLSAQPGHRRQDRPQRP